MMELRPLVAALCVRLALVASTAAAAAACAGAAAARPAGYTSAGTMQKSMDRYQAHVSLLAVLLTGAMLAVLAASPAAAGDSTAGLAGGMGAAAYIVDSAAGLRQLTMPDVHRRILISLTSSVFEPNRPACIGTCAGAGRPYTGRGCQSAYQCRQR